MVISAFHDGGVYGIPGVEPQARVRHRHTIICKGIAGLVADHARQSLSG
jgi:hypothetical protein